ncbi:putative RNA-directed DNA polymerase [Tanacetum coccineum]
MGSIRVVLGLAASLDLEVEQMDVKTTFLHGDLDKEIYMEQPEGFQVKGKEDYACRLQKSLYGLKQAPRQWYKKFESVIRKQGFRKTFSDHCIFFQRVSTWKKLSGPEIAHQDVLSVESVPILFHLKMQEKSIKGEVARSPDGELILIVRKGENCWLNFSMLMRIKDAQHIEAACLGLIKDSYYGLVVRCVKSSREEKNRKKEDFWSNYHPNPTGEVFFRCTGD